MATAILRNYATPYVQPAGVASRNAGRDEGDLLFADAPVDPRSLSRESPQIDIDLYNAWMREQPWWQETIGAAGGADGGAQDALTARLEGLGVNLDGIGLHIDNGGNINQENNTLKNIGIYGGLGTAALLTGGAAGLGPAAGLFGGSGASSALASSVPALSTAAAAPTAASGAAAAGGAAGGAGGLLGALGGPIGSTVLPAATGLLGAYMQSRANNKATDAQAHALEQALGFEKEQFEYQKGINEPFIGTGHAGTSNLRNYLDNPFTLPTGDEVRQTPGYQFAFNEGQNALEGSAFSRGVGLTGGAGKQLVQYGTNFADTHYGDYVNRLLAARQQNVGENQTAVEQALRASQNVRPA